jgi:hypothetical protein
MSLSDRDTSLFPYEKENTSLSESRQIYTQIQWNLTNSEFMIIRTAVFFAHYDLDEEA